MYQGQGTINIFAIQLPDVQVYLIKIVTKNSTKRLLIDSSYYRMFCTCISVLGDLLHPLGCTPEQADLQKIIY